MAQTEVTLRINADGKAAIAAVKQVDAGLEDAGQSGDLAGKRIRDSFASATSGVRAINDQLREAQRYLLAFAGIEFGKELVSSIVEANTKMQGFRYGLEAATGSSSAARDALAFVRAESERLGISLEDSAGTFTRLTAAAKGTSLEGAGVRQVFTSVAEAARTLHLSAAETQQALNALDQMMSKGTVQAQELKLQLGNVLPGATHIAADALGVTTQQLEKMIEQGKVASDEFLPKLAARLHELYGTTAAEAANSPAAAMERLKNAAFELKSAIGDAGFLSALADRAKQLTTALTGVVQSGALDLIVHGLFAIGEGMAIAFAINTISTIKSFITSMLLARVAIEGAADAQAVLNLRMSANVIGIIVTALAALYEAYRYVTDQQIKAAAQFAALNAQTQATLDATNALNQSVHAAGNAYLSIGAITKQYGTDLAQLADVRAEIAKKEQEYAEASVAYAERGIRSFDDTTPAAQRLKAELQDLNAKANALSGGMAQLAELITDIGVRAGKSADFVARMSLAFATLRSSASAGDVASNLKAIFAVLQNSSGDPAASAKRVADGVAALSDQATKARTNLDLLKLGIVGVAQAKEQETLETAKLGGASDIELASLKKTLDAKVADIAAEQAAKDAKKHHADTSLQLASAIDRLNGIIAQGAAGADPYAQAQAKLAKGILSVNEEVARAIKIGGDEQQLAQLRTLAITALVHIRDDEIAKVQASVKAYKDLVAIGEHLDSQNASLSRGLKDVSEAYDEYDKNLAKIKTDYAAALAGGADAAKAQAQELEDIEKAQQNLKLNFDTMLKGLEDRNLSPFDRMVKDLQHVNDELTEAKKKVDVLGQAKVDQLQAQIDHLKTSMQVAFIGSVSEALKGIQSLSKEGSKEYEEMRIAIDALAIAQAVLAVIHQGTSGDPYSAFVRMALMAGAVAPLLADIGAAISGVKGSGFSDSAAQRQQTQGTGTVLGDATKQSESIANAVAITADATSKLVAINTGMLDALRSLEKALGGAANMLAHGAGQADFSGQNLAVGQAGFLSLPGIDPLGILGGSKKVTDQGIEIFAGALGDMLQNVAVGAYQEVQSKSWAFGSTHTKTGISAVSDAFSNQFQLILNSIADTVRAGATALGLLPADIESAINAFQIAETKISLKGLSAEDQQKALEAVFSEIFDGLAGAVVPFIGQFQKVGEGLGETLVRVATEVQVTQEAMRQLGLVIDVTDPEKFAQIADGLVQMAGGVDAFIDHMNSFIADFAPDAFKFQTAQDTLTLALAQVGLALPSTREGFWNLLQSLDATTVAGQKQIATLLGLTDTANAYYGMLDKQQTDANQAAADFQTLVENTAQLAGQLFGTSIDQLTAQISTLQAKVTGWEKDTGLLDFTGEKQIRQLQDQLAAAQAQADAAQHLQQASQLLDNLGQIGARTGLSLSDLATQFNFPLDKLEEFLGTDDQGIQKQFDQIVATAKATSKIADNTEYANKLLADLLAQMRGVAPPYSDADLAAARNGNTPTADTTISGGKIGIAHVAAAPTTAGNVVAAPATQGNAQPTTDTGVTRAVTQTGEQTTGRLDQVITRLDRLNGNLARAGGWDGTRNSRPIRVA